jgi:hypothetical protein
MAVGDDETVEELVDGFKALRIPKNKKKLLRK